MMLPRLLHHIAQFDLFHPREQIILAVSAGLDSVVMLDLFDKAKFNYAIAHCDFRLRASESDEDKVFVQNLAARYNAPLFVTTFDTKKYAKEEKISLQMAARQLRYTWFEQLLDQHSYHYVATAHHQNDVLETLLLNISRGTGISGLHGIAAKKNRLIRPMLFANKAEINQYAKDNQLPWREDSSNLSNKYKRNLIRNEVIPWLYKINPTIEKTTAETVERLQQVEKIFQEKVALVKQQAITTIEGITYIDLKPFAEESLEVLLLECLKPYDFLWSDVKMMAAALHHTGVQFLSRSHQLVVDRSKLVISKIQNTKDEEGNIDKQDVEYCNLDICFSIKCLPVEVHQLSQSTNTASVDFRKVLFPLVVRRWKAGDKFYPLGMKGAKKVSDYLIDKKIPLNVKEKVWVLLSQGEIVWVIGHRLDDRFKITPQTLEVLQLELMPGARRPV